MQQAKAHPSVVTGTSSLSSSRDYQQYCKIVADVDCSLPQLFQKYKIYIIFKKTCTF